MRQALIQLLGLMVVAAPFVAITWNLAGRSGRRSSSRLAPPSTRTRWRLEVYAVHHDALEALVDPAEVPFPMKRVRSARSADGASPATAWARPRVELDVEVGDPLADETLTALFGTEHRVRFATGNEVVLEARSHRLRVRAIQFGPS